MPTVVSLSTYHFCSRITWQRGWAAQWRCWKWINVQFFIKIFCFQTFIIKIFIYYLQIKIIQSNVLIWSPSEASQHWCTQFPHNGYDTTCKTDDLHNHSRCTTTPPRRHPHECVLYLTDRTCRWMPTANTYHHYYDILILIKGRKFHRFQ